MASRAITCGSCVGYQSLEASPPLLPLLLPLEPPLLLPPPSPPPPHDIVLPSAHEALEPPIVHADLYVDAMAPVVLSAPAQ